ncbi:MAG: Mut7-C RNAse domain-containing protein, partial [Candidatus Hermodarchaeota archaeon]
MKFLTDSMFGKLTRFLRIFGYDTVYANDLTTFFNIDPVPDDYLI